MDYLQRLIRQAKLGLFIVILVDNAVLIGGWWLGNKLLGLKAGELVGFLLIIALAETTLIATSLGKLLMQPVKALWQTILHLTPSGEPVAAPQPESLHFGRDLVTNLSTHIYQLTVTADQAIAAGRQQSADISRNFVAQNLPLPLLVLDSLENIKFANEAAAQYLGLKVADMLGKNVYMLLDMSFPSEDTFDSWLKTAKLKNATASMAWERVRLGVRDSHPERRFDLAAYYNRDNTEHNETMLVLFDHTKQYSQDDQAVGFIALSVHELRTPLTLLRGYIEVFEDEIDTSGNPELADFMEKMHSQAEQLMAFVNNILNVARVDDDQLELHLEQASWPDILRPAIQALSLRAKVRGLTLNCTLATNLPPVGVDRISIVEVLNNLVDNAIKYSGTGTVIEIDTHLTQDGLVETTVRDHGLGIPSGVMPNLFTKFYRDHRNRAQIGGTGLGLYLSKAIVDAHGGTLWVRSKEGEGSTFGFTLLPYTQLADDAKKTGNQELVRNAHGWIKNHSLYRR